MSGDDPADQANTGLTFSPVFEDIADFYHGHSNWLFEAAQSGGPLCDSNTGAGGGDKSGYDLAMPPAFTFDEAGLQDAMLAPEACLARQRPREGGGGEEEADGDDDEDDMEERLCGSSNNRAVHRPTEDKNSKTTTTITTDGGWARDGTKGSNTTTAATSACAIRLQAGLQPLMLSQALSFPQQPQQQGSNSNVAAANYHINSAMPLPFRPMMSPSFAVGSPAGSLGSTSTQSPHIRATKQQHHHHHNQQQPQMSEGRANSNSFTGRLLQATTHTVPASPQYYTASPISASGGGGNGSHRAAMAGTNSGASLGPRHNAVLSSSSIGNVSACSTPAQPLALSCGVGNTFTGTSNSASSNMSSNHALHSGQAAAPVTTMLSSGALSTEGSGNAVTTNNNDSNSKRGSGQAMTTGPYTTGGHQSNHAAGPQLTTLAMRGCGPGEVQQSVAGLYHGMNPAAAAAGMPMHVRQGSTNIQQAPPPPPPPPPQQQQLVVNANGAHIASTATTPLLFPQSLAPNQMTGPVLSNMMLCSPYAATSMGAAASYATSNNTTTGGACVTFPALGGTAQVWPPQPSVAAQAASAVLRNATDRDKDATGQLPPPGHDNSHSSTQQQQQTTAGRLVYAENNSNTNMAMANFTAMGPTTTTATVMPPYYMAQQQPQQPLQQLQPMTSNNSNNNLVPAATTMNMAAPPGQPVVPLDSLYVFDSDYKRIFRVPAFLVRHLPPSRLNITRLVLCRHYKSCQPWSCPMGPICKFVHADCDYGTLPSHSVHVNYVWRDESACIYQRLPPGSSFEVQTVEQDVVEVQPQQVLRTRGSLLAEEVLGPLTCCPDYDHHGVCFLGEDCLRVHRVVVDPTVQGTFKRAPRRMKTLRHCGGTTTNTTTSTTASPVGTMSNVNTLAIISPVQPMMTATTMGKGNYDGVAATMGSNYGGPTLSISANDGHVDPTSYTNMHAEDDMTGPLPHLNKGQDDSLHDSRSTTQNTESTTTPTTTTTMSGRLESPPLQQGIHSAPTPVLTVPNTRTHTRTDTTSSSDIIQQSLLPPPLTFPVSVAPLPSKSANGIDAEIDVLLEEQSTAASPVVNDNDDDDKDLSQASSPARSEGYSHDAGLQPADSPATSYDNSATIMQTGGDVAKLDGKDRVQRDENACESEIKDVDANGTATQPNTTSNSTVTAMVSKLLTHQHERIDKDDPVDDAQAVQDHIQQDSTDVHNVNDDDDDTTSYMTIRIALNAHARQVLQDETSLGTLLLLPRNAHEAMVLGPVQRDAAEFARLLH